MFLIWGADSAAYFGGRRFGKRKLAPGSARQDLGGDLCRLGNGRVLALVSGLLMGLDARRRPA
jgi:hypothetical protein